MNFPQQIWIAAIVLLSGCASIDGTGSSDKLACPMPDGSTCTRMSDAYQETVYGPHHPKAQQITSSNASPVENAVVPNMPVRPLQATIQAIPLRSSPRTLRMWIAPWKDTDGDLIGEARAYLKVDDGDWQIDYIRTDIRKSYTTPLLPPPRAQTVGDEPKQVAAPTSPMANPLFRPAASNPTEN
jgi:conjugal transfer pilus assembly protein TraV